jgi:hypothetical protein
MNNLFRVEPRKGFPTEKAGHTPHHDHIAGIPHHYRAKPSNTQATTDAFAAEFDKLPREPRVLVAWQD